MTIFFRGLALAVLLCAAAGGAGAQDRAGKMAALLPKPLKGWTAAPVRTTLFKDGVRVSRRYRRKGSRATASVAYAYRGPEIAANLRQWGRCHVAKGCGRGRSLTKYADEPYLIHTKRGRGGGRSYRYLTLIEVAGSLTGSISIRCRGRADRICKRFAARVDGGRLRDTFRQGEKRRPATAPSPSPATSHSNKGRR